jgi:osmotically inducible protein OsmC
MTTLYSTKATALAGRNGSVATDDGKVSLELSYPKEMGGSGKGSNPEQLFAAGYAACFSNAILHVAGAAKIKLKAAPVTAEVGIVPREDGGFALTVSLDINLDLPQADADNLVKTAHQVCPYSNAVRNNIDVQISVTGNA